MLLILEQLKKEHHFPYQIFRVFFLFFAKPQGISHKLIINFIGYFLKRKKV